MTSNNFQQFCGGTPLWNASLTWGDTSWPEFTQCFQDSLLIWIPCGFLWIAAPFYLYYLFSIKNGRLSRPVTKFTISKIFFCLFISLLIIIQLIARISERTQHGAVIYVSMTWQILSFILAAVFMELERRCAIFSSAILFIFWTLNLFTGIIPFYSKIEKHENLTNELDFILYYVMYALMILEFIFHFFVEVNSQPGYTQSEDDKFNNPEYYASFPSRLSFWWLNKLIKLSYRQTLNEDDMFALHPKDEAKCVIPKFDAQWEREVRRCNRINEKRRKKAAKISSGPSEVTEKTSLLEVKRTSQPKKAPKKKEPSLLRVLARTFGTTLLKSHLCKFTYDIFQFVSPLVLNYLIAFTESKEAPWKGYTMAVIMLIMTTLQSIFSHQNYHIGMRTGMRVEKSLISAIYRKSLIIKPEEKKKYTTGEIINLMSVDSSNINNATAYIWIIWSAPLQICIALYFLYETLGSAIFTGIAIFFLMIPINGLVTKKLANYQKQQMTIKDERIKLTNEILNGIKVLKLYAWEPSFQEKINNIRKTELRTLQKAAYFQSFNRFSWMCMPFLVTLATFATYVEINPNHYLDAQKAFVSLSLFNLIQSPINLLPMMLVYLIQCGVSLLRINRYLNGEDLDPCNTVENPNIDAAILMKNASFSWDKEESNILENISFEVSKGNLVAVVGTVGCGKSSLISAILGEMNKNGGTVNMKGSVAYVPQEAWIQNTTLKNNILFNKEDDPHLYNTVIDACALKSDLELLDGGDQTEIGEKGINLSGGQKQRVSLARAVYHDADIYLLDDPLSAVDSHVGKHIFDNIISHNGLLKNKTRVLVTHGIHWLPFVDSIIVLSNGRISGIGTYDELIENNATFAQFLTTYNSQETNALSDEDSDNETAHRQRLESENDSALSTSYEKSSIMKRSISVDSSTSRQLKRMSSVVSNKSATEEIKELPTVVSRLTEDEFLETGQVDFQVYMKYVHSMGFGLTVVMLLFGIFYQFSNVYSSVWLRNWTQDPLLQNVSNFNSSAYEKRTNYYLGIYGALGVTQALMMLAFSVISAFTQIAASKILHSDMLESVLKSPMAYFDTTPLGRILNRFAKDIGVVDNLLPGLFRSVILNIFVILSTVLVISINTPVFLAAAVPLSVLYYFVQRYYIPTSRQLKRIESITRSYVFSHFSETLSGTSCIRAFKVQDRFHRESLKRVDKTNALLFTNYASNRWLGFRLEFIGNLISFAAAIFSVAERDILSGVQVGLSLTYAFQITLFLNILVTSFCTLQSNVVSVERIKQYSSLVPEAPWSIESTKPKKEWPEFGKIEFQKYSTRYRPGLQLVIKNISCKIKSSEKIGIVGRTGAGKSSLSLCLFRIIEAAAGKIIIDGLSIADLGLHELRRKLTILPQDPVLFSGTVRMNLDPFDYYTDDAIWLALEQAHLKETILLLENGINHECSEGGRNFSVGQRQLICLARTLLHKTKILILDEATAAVDIETDELIQQTIRTQFKDCTIITIAHRLNTILDYDKIMVLDAGKIKEFASPQKLLQDENSLFYSLAKDAQIVS